MKAVTAEEMRRAEDMAMSHGWTEGNLLRLAGRRLGWAIGRFFPMAGTAVAYLGKGHNAGDAVVALGVLRDHFGWKIAARPAFPESQWAPLLRDVWQEAAPIPVLTREPHTAETKLPLLLIDGLAGIAVRDPDRDIDAKPFGAELQRLGQRGCEPQGPALRRTHMRFARQEQRELVATGTCQHAVLVDQHAPALGDRAHHRLGQIAPARGEHQLHARQMREDHRTTAARRQRCGDAVAQEHGVG